MMPQWCRWYPLIDKSFPYLKPEVNRLFHVCFIFFHVASPTFHDSIASPLSTPYGLEDLEALALLALWWKAGIQKSVEFSWNLFELGHLRPKRSWELGLPSASPGHHSLFVRAWSPEQSTSKCVCQNDWSLSNLIFLGAPQEVVVFGWCNVHVVCFEPGQWDTMSINELHATHCHTTSDPMDMEWDAANLCKSQVSTPHQDWFLEALLKPSSKGITKHYQTSPNTPHIMTAL